MDILEIERKLEEIELVLQKVRGEIAQTFDDEKSVQSRNQRLIQIDMPEEYKKDFWISDDDLSKELTRIRSKQDLLFAKKIKLEDERARLELIVLDKPRDNRVSKRGNKSTPDSAILNRRVDFIKAFLITCDSFQKSGPTLEELADISKSSKAAWGRMLNDHSFLFLLKQSLEKKSNLSKTDDTREFWQSAITQIDDRMLKIAGRLNKNKITRLGNFSDISNSQKGDRKRSGRKFIDSVDDLNEDN